MTIRNFILGFLFFTGVTGVAAGPVGDDPVAGRLSSDFVQHTVTTERSIAREGDEGVVIASCNQINTATRFAERNHNRGDDAFVTAAAGE